MAPIHHHFELCGWKEGKVVSDIKTYVNDGGNQILDITEGEKHDVLTINSDGSLYIDGKKVIIEDKEPNSIMFVSRDKAGDEIIRIMEETQLKRFHEPKAPRFS